MEVVRRQALDLSTSKGLPPSSPNDCTYNLADSGIMQPNYPSEVAMDIAVTSVCFPNMITAVNLVNSRFFVIDGSGNVFPIQLPFQNFKGLSGLAAVLQSALISATLQAWTVVPANNNTNTLTFTLPSTITTTYTFVFTDTVVNGAAVRAYTSACKLMGFRQGDVMTATAAQPTITSTVPCQASGSNIVYIMCDLFSLEGATIDVLDNTRRGSILAKLQICDAPYTTATYQDQLTTFKLKMPAFSVSQFTVLLLNEELQKVNMPVDWSFSAVVQYYGQSPLNDIGHRLIAIEELLRYMFVKMQHDGEDAAKQARIQNDLKRTLERFQGQALG